MNGRWQKVTPPASMAPRGGEDARHASSLPHGPQGTYVLMGDRLAASAAEVPTAWGHPIRPPAHGERSSRVAVDDRDC